ncbi:hypothetical protein HUN08_13260 [Gordonia sp. X0973]|uniref:hypothetical protein n=1 Tax=Gordonia sp. X0973 TaxID=2742602 RepID=UPI000F51EA1E|nr:hypothetical protein [Gordonia sp. X0973]QKT08044.1 hypothetical protein HUN08_13260 [Gordonia sp. X0973]
MDLAERYEYLRDGDDENIEIVEAFVRAYTRGVGFDKHTGLPIPALAGVILAAAKRLEVSPIIGQATEGGEVRYDVFKGFNLAELSVLNDYRRRSA